MSIENRRVMAAAIIRQYHDPASSNLVEACTAIIGHLISQHAYDRKDALDGFEILVDEMRNNFVQNLSIYFPLRCGGSK